MKRVRERERERERTQVIILGKQLINISKKDASNRMCNENCHGIFYFFLGLGFGLMYLPFYFL
jgi:hypothetical protein